MSNKRHKQTPERCQEENQKTAFRFKAVYSHFSQKKENLDTLPVKGLEYSLTPTLEIRQAMSQAKSAYESMRNIQKHLNQAYKEIIKDPS